MKIVFAQHGMCLPNTLLWFTVFIICTSNYYTTYAYNKDYRVVVQNMIYSKTKQIKLKWSHRTRFDVHVSSTPSTPCYFARSRTSEHCLSRTRRPFSTRSVPGRYNRYTVLFLVSTFHRFRDVVPGDRVGKKMAPLVQFYTHIHLKHNAADKTCIILSAQMLFLTFNKEAYYFWNKFTVLYKSI